MNRIAGYLRIDLLPGDRAEQPDDHDPVIGLQAAFDNAQIALDRLGLHLALLDDIFVVHHEQISSGLIAAQCSIRDE